MPHIGRNFFIPVRSPQADATGRRRTAAQAEPHAGNLPSGVGSRALSPDTARKQRNKFMSRISEPPVQQADDKAFSHHFSGFREQQQFEKDAQKARQMVHEFVTEQRLEPFLQTLGTDGMKKAMQSLLEPDAAHAPGVQEKEALRQLWHHASGRLTILNEAKKAYERGLKLPAVPDRKFRDFYDFILDKVPRPVPDVETLKETAAPKAPRAAPSREAFTSEDALALLKLLPREEKSFVRGLFRGSRSSPGLGKGQMLALHAYLASQEDKLPEHRSASTWQAALSWVQNALCNALPPEESIVAQLKDPDKQKLAHALLGNRDPGRIRKWLAASLYEGSGLLFNKLDELRTFVEQELSQLNDFASAGKTESEVPELRLLPHYQHMAQRLQKVLP